MAVRLNNATLSDVQNASQPGYSRESVQPGIVHLGLGAFHRAHQAVYTDDLLANGDARWGIVGASLRNPRVQDTLRPQDCLYIVQTLGRETYQVIGSIMDSLVLPADLAQLLAHMCNSSIQVVTLTVTEKGYCVNTDGQLDWTHPDIVHDMANPTQPRSAPGVLALGLAERCRNGAAPITVVSCDNMIENGAVTQNAVTALVDRLHPDASNWVHKQVSFPSSMVDRIVPRTTDDQRQKALRHCGVSDEAGVVAEPFSQWVIEDRFAGERPPWHLAGVQYTDNIAPWEQAKLRLLNATHSALAYLGLLAGYDFIHEALGNATLVAFARHLLTTEIIPTVTPPDGLDLNDYSAHILERFANPSVPYQTRQVAADGSKKLPQRVYPSIRARLAQSAGINALSLVVAAWLRSLERSTEDSTFDALNDPVQLTVFAESALLDARSAVEHIAKDTPYFGDLAGSAEFRNAVADALLALRTTTSTDCARDLMR